ncbi:hypothetical protein [Shewanella sp. UCD-KL12]|uniref:hypothetical protein n=1 Tax=Shewanella sp. UCD-KL12 TaxID=1917163 RepID=UPI0009710ED6|nr:hypothetical protein [Shewanella sp. UCD-KL12]
MNKIINIIDSLSDSMSISQQQTDALKEMVEGNRKSSFEFSGEFYSLDDVHPTSIGSALTPYLVSDVMVTSQNMVLQARYVERKSAFEFEIDLTLEGLKSLLIESTSISDIIINPVYATDELNIDHSTETITHVVSGDRTELDGLYCIVEFEDGQSIMNQMNATEAKQALYANSHQRLNGVNPYLSENKKVECYRLSCLRRTLKTISAMRSVKNCDFIGVLLNLHDSQYAKANDLRKVTPLTNRFRGCSKQPSKTDMLFKQAQGCVVVPFTNMSKNASKKDETIQSASAGIHKHPVWDEDEELGVGF